MFKDPGSIVSDPVRHGANEHTPKARLTSGADMVWATQAGVPRILLGQREEMMRGILRQNFQLQLVAGARGWQQPPDIQGCGSWC